MHVMIIFFKDSHNIISYLTSYSTNLPLSHQEVESNSSPVAGICLFLLIERRRIDAIRFLRLGHWLIYYRDDITLIGPGEQQMASDLDFLERTMDVKCCQKNSPKIQKATTSVKFVGAH